MPTIPSSTQILSDAAATANPFFAGLYPVMVFIVGLSLGVLLFLLIVGGVNMLIHHVKGA